MPLDQRPTTAIDPATMQPLVQGVLATAVASSASTVTGIGVDVVDIAGFTHNHTVGGDRWLRKLFTDVELADAEEDLAQLASTFAAKEAVVKALGTGFRGTRSRDVQIIRTTAGQPVAQLTGNAALIARRRCGSVHVSITKESGYAVAAAVIATALATTPAQGDRDEPSAR